MENTPLVELKELSFTYDSAETPIHAIHNINLAIVPQEFICLLGPSGCGKSTLLKLLAGYMKPTQGEAILKGSPIQGPDCDRGVVFQSPTLYPWLSVRKNIEFGPRMRGISEAECRQISDRFLKQIRMEEASDQASFELSGGMKQRVALARALANEPEVLLMDEPFGALDALTRLNMQRLMRRLWRENRSTFFMITHDIDEALSLATRILIMSPAPGTLMEEIPVSFTEQALLDEKGRVHPDHHYMELKEFIIDRIL